MFYPLEIAVFIVLFFGLAIIQSVSASALRSLFHLSGDVVSYVLLILYSTVVISIGITAYAIFVQKRPLSGLGFSRKRVNPGQDYGKGLFIGFLMMTAAVIIEMAFGFVHFTGFGGMEALPRVLLFLFGFMLQGLEEELECRGFFLVSIARRYPVLAGILTNALFFGLMHMGNKGATPVSVINTCLSGLMYSVIFLKQDSIWMAAGVHTAWNFTQSCIYGHSTSGLGQLPSLIKMEVPTGNSWITGGSYGVEASFINTLIRIAVILYFICRKEKSAPADTSPVI